MISFSFGSSLKKLSPRTAREKIERKKQRENYHRKYIYTMYAIINLSRTL